MNDMHSRDGYSTIGQLANAASVATSTLRYYEREGLLKPAARSRAGYRLYDPSATQQLHFIRSAQAVGFSLQDIKALFALDERTSCKQVQGIIEERLDEIGRRIAELKSVQRTLAGALARCKKSRKVCPVLGELSGKNHGVARGKRRRDG